MTYMLIAIFFTGDAYVERRHLTLNECAAHAALTRAKTQSVEFKIGRVRYVCLPEARS